MENNVLNLIGLFEEEGFQWLITRENFENHYQIIADRELSLYPPDEINVTFRDCVFNNGVSYTIDLDLLPATEINITFENCILGLNNSGFRIPNIIKHPDDVTLNINFFGCVIEQMELEKVKLSGVYFSRTVFSFERLLIRNCDIKNVHLDNTLGVVFVDNENSNLLIRHKDQNLVFNRRVLDQLERFLDRSNISLETLFGIKTDYYVYGGKSIRIVQGKSPHKGLKRHLVWDRRTNKHYHRPMYHLADQDVEKLKIGYYLDSRIKPVQRVYINADSCKCDVSLIGENFGSVNIDRLRVNRLFLSGFKGDRVSFSEIAPIGAKSTLDIHKSNLLNTTFDRIELAEFEVVNAYRSRLDGIYFVGANLHRGITGRDNVQDSDSESDIRVEYENYRQLKSAFNRIGDQKWTLEAHELMYEALAKDKSQPILDRLILWLNNLSNAHGTSIKRAFFLVFLLGPLLTVLYGASTPGAPYEWGWRGCESFVDANIETVKFSFSKGGAVLFKILNPTHRISSLQHLGSEFEVLSFGNNMISFTSRLIMAWLYYQFVMAFRKFGRKL